MKQQLSQKVSRNPLPYPVFSLIRGRKRLHPDVNFNRNTPGGSWDDDGLFSQKAIDEPRFNFNPVTELYEGLTIMGQWTNEILDPHDFTQNSWIKSSVTVNTDSGIDGNTYNIDIISGLSGSGDIEQDVTIPNDSNEHTVQVWLRKNMSENAKVESVLSGGTSVPSANVIDTTNGSVVSGSANIEDAGDFWEISFQISNNGSGNTSLKLTLTPNVAGEITPQTFSTPSLFLNRSTPPPTPVYGTTAGQSYTQDPDIAKVTDLSAINYNPDEGTFVVGFNVPNTGIMDWLFTVNDGTTNNTILFRETGGNFNGLIKDGNSNQLNSSTASSNGRHKFAIAYKDGELAFALDGSIIGTSTGTVPTVTQMNIGNDGSSNYANCFVNTLNNYPRRLSNAQLKQETQ